MTTMCQSESSTSCKAGGTAMRYEIVTRVRITHGHLFCGVGGGARGFNEGTARVGSLQAEMQCVGGIDVDAGALECFEALTGVKGTQLDLFTRQQYIDFHGKEPPKEWRETQPSDIRAAFSEIPTIAFLSPPCIGYSGLLPPSKSVTPKYRAVNELALRGIWLMLEAFADDPPALILMENVPRIAQRGRYLLDQIKALLDRFGYASAETVHDCGELAGLAETRKRFLLVARHRAKVPPYIYEPVKRSLRAIGDVLGDMPLPDDESAGPMHCLPRLKWETWVRLALIPAGKDWRALQDIDFEGLAIAPVKDWHGGALGVRRWTDTSGAVCGESLPHNGAFAIADPRFPHGLGDYQAYGVRAWGDTSGAIGGKAAAGAGAYSVADPREVPAPSNVFRVIHRSGQEGADAQAVGRFASGKSEDAQFQSGGQYGVQSWSAPSRAVVGNSRADSGPFSVADPRLPWSAGAHRNKLSVVPWGKHCGTVTGSLQVASGAMSVADPRLPGWKEGKTHPGKFAVADWNDHSSCITGTADVQSGAISVADPRAAYSETSPIIVSLDGTRHRPMTSLEGKYPPAKPGALGCEPLKAANRRR